MQNESDIQRLSYFTLNQSNEPFFWIDEEGTIQHVNPAAMKLSGFEYDAIVGKKIYDIHPDENEKNWTMEFISKGCEKLTGYLPNELMDNHILACSKTETLYENANTVQKKFSFEQIRDLPKPVQKYFNYALKENQPYVNSLRLKHGGMFRLSPEKDWMEIRGKQYFTADPPGFVWEGKTKLFKARDSYVNGEGDLSVYLFGLVRIVNKKGETINQAELLRWLGESVWMPTNHLPHEKMKWTPIDDISAKITFTANDMNVYYIVTFNNSGQILRLETERYMDENNLVKWIGKVSDYREVNGMMIPTKIEASWMLEEGEYTYARFHVDEFEFNKPEKF